MRVHLSRRYRFSASHRLHAAGMSAEENAAAYGKCNNPHGHGHNYVVEVTFSGEPDRHGMVLDLGALDAFAAEKLVERFDLQNLNALDLFTNSVPSTENLLVAVYEIVSGFSGAKLERVYVEETGNNSFELVSGA